MSVKVSENVTTTTPSTNSHTNPNKDSSNGTQTEQTQVVKHHRRPKQKPKPYKFTTKRPPKPLPEETDYFQGYVDLHDNQNSHEVYSDQGYDEPHNTNEDKPPSVPSHDVSIESDGVEDTKFPDDESEEEYKDSNIQTLPHTGHDEKNSSIPPGILSHYIPGDTPTLYAGPRNKTHSPQTGSSTPRPNSTKPPSTFSFFGVPIPPISGVSFNNFWGSKSNRDQNGRGRKVGGKFSRPPPTEAPAEGGFIPMLPGSGGFKPILNPVITSHGGSGPTSYQSFDSGENVEKHEEYNAQVGESYDSSPPRHATISKVSYSTNYSTSTSKPPRSNKPLPFIHPDQVHYIENSTHSPRRPHSGGSSFENEGSNPVHNGSPSGTASYENEAQSSYERPTNPGSYENGIASNSRPNSFENGGPGYENSALEHPRNQPKHRPSPLTGFLAPGGQLPPYVPTGTGRPTITKVSPSPLPGSSAVAGPVEDLQGFQSTLRLAKSPSQLQLQYYKPSDSENKTSTPPPTSTERTTTEKLTTERPRTTDKPRTSTEFRVTTRRTSTTLPLTKNDTMSWYFSNYNSTDMEPYVFAFPNTKAKSSNGIQIRVSLGVLLLSVMVSVV